MKKKGAVELSITTIVVIIIGGTFLGLRQFDWGDSPGAQAMLFSRLEFSFVTGGSHDHKAGIDN